MKHKKFKHSIVTMKGVYMISDKQKIEQSIV
ncbi:hypothetical protein B0I21_103461 [Sphingobacterium paludis]|uniref:Uncharacterized protein n=1 Tax=Sphingobacterium paludis TaxID=1476465 RepID=A0A4R7D1V5_9SPHI|nr:hypothetical protein B0I21_103461 [Sphingobacterium paludis]